MLHISKYMLFTFHLLPKIYTFFVFYSDFFYQNRVTVNSGFRTSSGMHTTA